MQIYNFIKLIFCCDYNIKLYGVSHLKSMVFKFRVTNFYFRYKCLLQIFLIIQLLSNLMGFKLKIQYFSLAIKCCKSHISRFLSFTNFFNTSLQNFKCCKSHLSRLLSFTNFFNTSSKLSEKKILKYQNGFKFSKSYYNWFLITFLSNFIVVHCRQSCKYLFGIFIY